MDEDLLKRNTDCVYFLASPLTCKKGADCEYRHNEIARLNPRDCWYWLSGSCLNPTCAFRHPPLEGHTGVPSEPTQSSLSANKTVPCYFFYNGFCNKGDRCSFLHGKPGKNDSGGNDALPNDAFPSENKTSSENNAGLAITTETYPDPSEIAQKTLHTSKIDPVEDPQRSVLKNVKQKNTLPEISDYEYKEATVIRSDSVSPEKDYVHCISHICTGLSTEEQVHNHMEPEERLESSPGFDVLVDDEMEDPAYEDDSECIPVDRERTILNGQYLQYEYKDTIEYDPECSEAEIMYEEMYGGCRFMDGDHIIADDRIIPAFSRERIIDSIMSRKRIQMPAEMTACDRNLDLRYHLSRQREVNGRPVTGFFRSREPSFQMIQNQERLRRHGFDQRLSRRQLTSEVGFNTLDSNGEGETWSKSNRHSLFRYPLQHSPRTRRMQHYRENRGKQQFLPSKIFRKSFAKRRRYTPTSTDTAFHGPKTLAEIKEEKAAVAERGHFNSTLADFRDPKPLSEILKGKKRMDGE